MKKQTMTKGLKCLGDSVESVRGQLLQRRDRDLLNFPQRFLTQMAMRLQQIIPEAGKLSLQEYMQWLPDWPGWPDPEGAFQYPLLVDGFGTFTQFCHWSRVRPWGMNGKPFDMDIAYTFAAPTWLFCDVIQEWQTSFNAMRKNLGVEGAQCLLQPVEGILLLRMYPSLLTRGESMLVAHPKRDDRTVCITRSCDDGDKSWIDMTPFEGEQEWDQVFVPTKYVK